MIKVNEAQPSAIPSAENATHLELNAAPIYVASRASVDARGRMWRGLRDNGVRITSTWIDECGEGATDSMEELWLRITSEIAESAALVLYAEFSDFPLKGAFIEAGIALGMGKPVVVCLPGVPVEPRSCRPIGSWINHPLVSRVDDIHAAIALASTQVTCDTRDNNRTNNGQASNPKSSSRDTEVVAREILEAHSAALARVWDEAIAIVKNLVPNSDYLYKGEFIDALEAARDRTASPDETDLHKVD